MKNIFCSLIIISILGFQPVAVLANTNSPELHYQAVSNSAVSARPIFVSFLRRGISGEEVGLLQMLLSQFPKVYPESLVTGFFGRFTEAAVMRFQDEQGIEVVGVVGPKTRAKLNQLASSGMGLGFGTIADPPGRSGEASGRQGPPAQTPSGTTPAQPATPAQPFPGTGTPAQPATPAMPAQPGSEVFPTPTPTPTLIPTPTPTPPAPIDFTSPAISNIQTSNITSNSATISWLTDEPASSAVYYEKNLASFSSSTVKAIGTDGVTSHAVTLTNLLSATTYQYIIVSADASGNTSTSSWQYFLTAYSPTPSPTPTPTITAWNNIRLTSLLNEGLQIQGTNIGLAYSHSNYGIVWISNNSDVSDVYLMVIDAAGNKITQNKIKVSNLQRPFRPKILGIPQGFSIFWEDHQSGTIQMATFDSVGDRLTANKTILSVTGNNYVDAVWNGSGYGLSWHSPEYVLFFGRFDLEGNQIGSTTLISSDMLSSNNDRPRMVWSGSEYGITWGTKFSLRNVYFAKINANGIKQNDVQISSCGSDWCGWPSLYWNGGGYGLSWENVTQRKYYLTNISASGAMQATILLADSFQETPELFWSGTEYGFVWHQLSSIGEKILNFVKLDANGNKTTDAVNIISGTQPRYFNCSVPIEEIFHNGTNYILVWNDSRDNTASLCLGEIYFAIGNVNSSSVSPAPALSPTPIPTPISTKFFIGDRIKVSSGPLNVRDGASVSTSTILGTQPIDAFGIVTGGPEYGDLYWWWNIDYDSGADGWSAEDYLTKAETPAPTGSN